MTSIADHLREHSVVAILRDVPVERILGLGEALAAGGILSMEVPFTDPDAESKIVALKKALSTTRGVVVGAGTVTTVGRAAAALAAGAEFLVTPHVETNVVHYAYEHEMPVICGATTATEIANALEAGADFIKLFPAGPLGPEYLKALFGPYPSLEVFAVGGLGAANAGAFLKAGAIGIGVGGALTSLDWSSPDFQAATSLARELVKITTGSRQGSRQV